MGGETIGNNSGGNEPVLLHLVIFLSLCLLPSLNPSRSQMSGLKCNTSPKFEFIQMPFYCNLKL